METFNTIDKEFGRKLAFTHIAKGLADLFDCILTDAVTDIEVAARDRGISDASFVRLRRAMDRVACAQSLVESMRAGSVGASDDETGMRMRDAVELLARGWPEDYPAGAVEGLIADGFKPIGLQVHVERQSQLSPARELSKK
ncbi:hypothetical protein [Paraburkholderia terrae]